MNETLGVLIYEELLELSKEPELCEQRNVYAAIIPKRGGIFFGRNGCEHDPCTKEGNYCKREKGPAEYVTCPSFCAEGLAILRALGQNYDSLDLLIDALFGEKILEGSTLISTGFPCGRCVSMAIDAGISEIYFGKFKEDEEQPRDDHHAAQKNFGKNKKGGARLIDEYYAAQMAYAGIKLRQVVERTGRHGTIKHVVKEIDPDLDMEWFAIGKARTSGEAFVRMMFDRGYRKVVINGANFLKENLDPFMKIDDSCFIFPNRWEQYPDY